MNSSTLNKSPEKIKVLTTIDPDSTIIKDQEKRDRMAKLIEALTSGEYRRVFGSLRAKNGFCPLGLACHLSDLGTWKKRPGFPNVFVLNDDRITEYLIVPPSKVTSSYGFVSNQESGHTPGCFYLNPYHEFRWLAIALMNDTFKLHPNIIGKCLEKTYLTGWK